MNKISTHVLEYAGWWMPRPHCRCGFAKAMDINCSFAVKIAVLCMMAVDALLLLFGLLHPSFLAVGLFYDFNTVVVPLVLGIFAIRGFMQWNRQPYDKGILRMSSVFAALAIGSFGTRVYATYFEPCQLEVRRALIVTAKVSRPVRILHISDIQSGATGKYEEKVFQHIRELCPDIICFTGDLLQPVPPATFESELPKLAGMLETLTPSNGIWGVCGDVDERVLDFPESGLGGMQIMENRSVSLDTDSGRIRLLGLSPAISRARHEARQLVGAWQRQVDPDDFTIVLGHSPDYALAMKDIPVDLCLAGHTHGGQVRLPLLGPIITLSRVPRSWARGFRNVGKTRLNVSAGIGCERAPFLPPIRFHCRPEMTLIELVPDRINGKLRTTVEDREQ